MFLRVVVRVRGVGERGMSAYSGRAAGTGLRNGSWVVSAQYWCAERRITRASGGGDGKRIASERENGSEDWVVRETSVLS